MCDLLSPRSKALKGLFDTVVILIHLSVDLSIYFFLDENPRYLPPFT